MEDCIFCKIVKNEIPAHKVYEDDGVLGFLDIRPISLGHVLVIPKNHIDEFQDMGEDLYDHVMTVVQKIARKLKQELAPRRIGVITYGFDVKHAHIHVFPMERPGLISYQHTAGPTEDQMKELSHRLSIG